MADENDLLPDTRELQSRNPGKDMNGHFARGNRLAGGNPDALHHAKLRKQLRDATKEGHFEETYDVVRGLAKSGDIQAIKLLWSYWLGNPAQSVQVTGADGGGVKLDVARLTTVILTALGPDHEARYRIAAALRQITLETGEQDSGPDNGSDASA